MLAFVVGYRLLDVVRDPGQIFSPRDSAERQEAERTGPYDGYARQDGKVKVAKPAQPLDVTADSLAASYRENEVEADSRFKGRLLSVSGTVETVGKDILGDPYVLLGGQRMLGSVQCLFATRGAPLYQEPMLRGLRRGQTLRLTCECSGKLVNVILRDCKF